MKTILFLLLLGSAALSPGCSGEDAQPPPEVPDELPAPPPPCFSNPQTHEELINACTAADVERIEKRPVLPMLNSNGTLPPIP
jgi:hypothetical protein